MKGKRVSMISRRNAGALGLLAASCLGLALASPTARADVTQVTSCTLSGNTLPAIDAVIYEKAAGTAAIAKLTGGRVGVSLSDFLAGGSDRVRVKTSAGAGGFRVEGWVDASKLSLFVNKNVAVVQNHVWIGAQREVTVIGAGSGKLRVKRQVGSPFNQAFMGWADCGALTLTATTPNGWTPPGKARAYVAKKDVDLYDSGDDGRSVVTQLTPDSSSDGIVLWSTERKGGWVHVEHHSDVVIDAWARASDLKALPRGETQDSQAAATSRRNPPILKLSGNAKTATSPKDLTLRASAGEKGKSIGVLESGAEVYVLDIVAGWASVLPKALHVSPVGDGQFWVKASELGVSP